MNKIATLFCVPILLYSSELYCNIMWPIAFMAGGHYSIFSFLLMFTITMFAKTVLLRTIIKNITINRSLLISFVGNIISVLLGGVMLYLLFVVKSHPYFVSFASVFRFLPFISGLASNLIELLVIKWFFGYSFRQLLIPILIGNTAGTFLSAALWDFFIKPFVGGSGGGL